MATMFRKALTIALDAAQEGSFTARIATFNVVDKDGDVTLAGAFHDGKRVLVSAYMHGSWSGRLPVGDGVISSDASGAYFTGKFWLNTDAGQQTYLAVKNAGELQEYSYGFATLDSSENPADLSPYPGARQILKKLDVIEVSPVLVGAGVNTGTLAIKSARMILGGPALLKARETVARLKAGTLDSAMIAAIANIDALSDDLDDAVDALMVQAGIPDPDEDGSDGETDDGDGMDPAPLSSGYDMMDPSNGKGFTFAAHGEHALAGVRAFISRAKSLADLRAKKQRKDGRVISATNRTRLNALHDSLAGMVVELRDLLDSTDAAPPGDDGAGSKAAEDAILTAVWLDMQRRQAELVAIN